MDFNQIQSLANEAATIVDHTEVTEGFEREIAAAGATMARFTGYVETGKQPQPDFNGKPKPPANEVRLTFDLLTPARVNQDGSQWPGHVREITVDGQKKMICDKLHLTLAIKLNDRAGFTKLFKAMRYGRDNIKHMAQMIGEPFLMEIVHQKAKKSDRVYATIKKDGNWTISAPFVPDVNNFGQQIPAPIPQVLDNETFKLFLWDKPTPETWQMLFIDGTREITKDGQKVQVSKNFLQGAIMSAVNFEGSPVHMMLAGLGVEIDEAAKAAAQGLQRSSDDDDEDSAEGPTPPGHTAAADTNQMMLQSAGVTAPSAAAAPVQATQVPQASPSAAVAPSTAQQQPVQEQQVAHITGAAEISTIAEGREPGKASPGKQRRTKAQMAEDEAYFAQQQPAAAPQPVAVAPAPAPVAAPVAEAPAPAVAAPAAAPAQLDTSNMTPENITALKAMGVIQ